MRVGELCARYLSDYPHTKGTQRGTLERLQHASIAKVKAPGSSKDYIAYSVELSKTCAPGTVRQYIVQLRGVLAYAKPGWGIEDVTDAPIREAYPLLKKQGLIGIAKRRKQSPTQEQINELTEYWKARAHTTRIPMYDIVPFQYDSTRRIVETVGLMWGDLNEQYKTILVRNMKHNRGKPADKEVAIPDPAFEIIMRQPRRTTDPTERIFPYTKSAIQWQWPIGLRACGLRGLLHLHDLRRGGTTKLLKAGVPPNKVILVTGHDTFDMVMTTYNAMTARDFHA